MNKKMNEFLSDIKDIAGAELLDVLLASIPGPMGIVLPSIGRVFLGSLDKKKEQKEIEEIKKQIDQLEEKEKKECERTIREILQFLVKDVASESVEIYLIDGFKLFLKETDDIEQCLYVLQNEKKEKNPVLEQYIAGEIFVWGEALVFNLTDHYYREDLEELIDEIREIIEEYRECSWGDTIRKIAFY